jgi:type II secretory pathway component PulF
LVTAPAYQDRMAHCRNALQRGQALAEALRGQALPISQPTWQLLRVGEHSGALEHALQRRLREQSTRVEDCQRAAVVWLPRVYYVGVLSVAGGLLTAD